VKPSIDEDGKELESLYEAHLQALRMFEKLIHFIPEDLSVDYDAKRNGFKQSGFARLFQAL
jgi:hypothetical protein